MAIQIIMSQQKGALPITANFSAPSDAPSYLEITGSVWSTTANQMLGIAVQLDGQAIGNAQIFSNTASTHRAVVPTYIPVKLQQGQHSLTLSAMSGTTSDFNDFYTVVLHY